MEINQARYIPGFTSIYQHELYIKVASLLPPNPRFLEIGALLGRSSWAWLDVLPDDTTYDVLDSFNVDATEIPDFTWNPKRMPPPGKNLDTWLGICNKLHEMSHREVWNFVVEHHHKFGLVNNVISMSTTDYFKNNYRSVFDAIFIDADHGYKSVKETLMYFKDTKIICGDDYMNPDWPGVEKAVKEFAREYNFKLTEYPKNLFFILEKNDIQL